MATIPDPTIIRSRRSSISIQITREGEFIVKAPHFMPMFLINQFLKQKEDWITATYAKVHAHLPAKKDYGEGEEYMFLGVPRKLTFYTGIAIVVKENQLLFPKALQFRLQKELKNWFIAKAKEIIQKRLVVKANEMGAEYKSIMFSDTSSKWGTCTHDNRLQFNWRLVMAPLMVLDYVVIHELAHTTEKNHGNSFWQKVARFTPAFKQHRKWLNTNAHLLVV